MTNCNYTQEEISSLTSEIKSIVESSYHGWHNKLKVRRDLIEFINWMTPLLNDEQYTLSTKVYWVLNGITEFPTCKVDNKPFIGMNVNLHSGYPTYCSQSCQWKDDECCSKRAETFRNRTPEQRKRTLEKTRETCQKRYHSNTWQSSDEGRIQCSLIYKGFSDEKKKSILDKRIKTTNEVYGCDNVFQNEDIKLKCKQTKIDRYDDAHYVNREKAIQTMIARYDVEYTFQHKGLCEKSISTKRELYGENLELLVEKAKSTKKERYGNENYNNSEKQIQTSKLNHNGLYHSQTIEFSKCHRKRIFHDGIYFDSTWEVSVYEFCKMNNIKFEYSPSITYEYEYDGKIYTYHPDFLIDGKVYEVKGDNFFRINESTGIEEMYCPWRYSEWSDEHYNWMCGKYEAKHQCILKNNVVILREGDMKNLEMRVKHTCVDA